MQKRSVTMVTTPKIKEYQRSEKVALVSWRKHSRSGHIVHLKHPRAQLASYTARLPRPVPSKSPGSTRSRSGCRLSLQLWMIAFHSFSGYASCSFPSEVSKIVNVNVQVILQLLRQVAGKSWARALQYLLCFSPVGCPVTSIFMLPSEHWMLQVRCDLESGRYPTFLLLRSQNPQGQCTPPPL